MFEVLESLDSGVLTHLRGRGEKFFYMSTIRYIIFGSFCIVLVIYLIINTYTNSNIVSLQQHA